MVVIALSNPMLKSVPKMSLSIVLGTTTHRMLFASNTAATATALRSPIMMLVVMLLLSRTPRIFARFWTANSGDTLELPKMLPPRGRIPETVFLFMICLLYTSDAADDLLCVDLGG